MLPSSRLSLIPTDIPSLDAAKITSGIFSNSRIDTGTAANKILQLDATAKIPAVDGSQLTNLSVSQVSGTLPVTKGGLGAATLTGSGILIANPAGTAVSSLTCATGEILKWSGTAWACADGGGGAGGGSVTDVTGSAPINILNGTTTPEISLNYGAGLVLNSGQLVVDSGTAANKILKLDGNGKIPTVDGSQITSMSVNQVSGILPVSKGGLGSNSVSANSLLMSDVTGSTISGVTCAVNEILKWSGTAWACAADNAGSGGVAEVTATAPIAFCGWKFSHIYQW